MNGVSGGITGLIDALLSLAGIHLAPGVAPAIVLVGALLLSPLLLRNQNTAKARRVLGRLTTATTARERATIEAEALALVEGNPDGLASLADAALQRGRSDLARSCLERLRTLGTRPAVVARLTRELDGDFPSTPEEILVRIEHQREAGLTVAAEQNLTRALRIWPDHPDLLRLQVPDRSEPRG